MKARWKCSPKGVFWLVAVLTATAGLFGAQDFRPPFDKRHAISRHHIDFPIGEIKKHTGLRS